MDGTLAVLFALASSADMGMNYCENECLARASVPATYSINIGDVQFQDESVATEGYIRFHMDRQYGPWIPFVGFSQTDQSSFWIGAGFAHRIPLGDSLYIESSLAPGYYARGDGPDLGYPLEFRSSLELNAQVTEGFAVGVGYDHRSNSDIETVNPGLETAYIRFTFAME